MDDRRVMSIDLALTPNNRITALLQTPSPEDDLGDGALGTPLDGQLNRVAKAFASAQAEGLFALATEKTRTAVSSVTGLLARVR